MCGCQASYGRELSEHGSSIRMDFERVYEAKMKAELQLDLRITSIDFSGTEDSRYDCARHGRSKSVQCAYTCSARAIPAASTHTPTASMQ